MSINIGRWDLVLIVVVALQATLLSYLKQPRWKAFIFSLPIPFTLSTMALGRPVSAANPVGLVVLFAYAQAVRLLHRGLRVPIVPAIAASALGYCAVGALLAPAIPPSGVAFWLAAGGVFALGAALYLALPQRREPDHRSELPVWIKLPVIAGVILALVLLKNTLQGFMTVFPFVGVVAAYEGRHSLWTLGRQVPAMMMLLPPLMAVSHVAQPYVGLGPSLALGWVAFLGLFLPFTWYTWRHPAGAAEARSSLSVSPDQGSGV